MYGTEALSRFVAFSKSILPDRVRSIRHVELQMIFEWTLHPRTEMYQLRNVYADHWRRACSALREMTGLHTLLINIGHGRYITRNTQSNRRRPVSGVSPESEVLNGLSGISHTSMQHFIVRVPWAEDITGDLSRAAFTTEVVDEYSVVTRRI